MSKAITIDAPFIGRVPTRSPETDPFWDACNENVFIVQKCRDCHKTQYHYRAICAHCWSSDLDDLPASGHGTIWTYSIVKKNRSPATEARGEYAVVLVELDEGVRVFGNIVESDLDDVAIGKDVTLVFAVADDGQHIPMFKLAEAAAT